MKIIDINYDPNTNITKVSLADKYGQYTGIAKLHPEDKYNYNHIVGGEIAEQRAFIKKLSEDIKRNRIMLKAIKNLLKDKLNHIRIPNYLSKYNSNQAKQTKIG